LERKKNKEKDKLVVVLCNTINLFVVDKTQSSQIWAKGKKEQGKNCETGWGEH